MELKNMPKNEIYSTIDFCYLNNRYNIQIILTNGMVLLGSIPVKSWTISESNPITAKERCFKKECLELYYTKIFNEQSIYVPIHMISGISIINYDQKKVPATQDSNLVASLYDLMFEELLKKAELLNLATERYFYQYSLKTTKPFLWGELSFKGEAALYSDWGYLSNISGGINSVGAGVGIISLSAGWDKSLWAVFKNKMDQKSLNIKFADEYKDGIIEGYVNFIERYELPDFEKVVDRIEMEGTKWLPAIVSENNIKHAKDFQNCNWCVAFFKEECMMLPLNAWEQISQKLRIYGEIIPFSISTEFGVSKFFLKVRCVTC